MDDSPEDEAERRKRIARERARERKEARQAYWAERAAQRQHAPTTKIKERWIGNRRLQRQRQKIDTPISAEQYLELERLRAKEYYSANKKEVLERARKKRENDPIGMAVKRMLTSARTRAKKHGGICTITEADIRRLVHTHCPALLIEIEINLNQPLPNSISLDKVIPSLWYVPENIAVISQRANIIKQDATSEVILGLAHNWGSIPTEPGPLDELRIPWGKSSGRYKATLLYHARERGLCDLKLEDFVIPELCPLTGIRLERGLGSLQKSSPTLDKIDPKLGYVRGNVAVVSMYANRIKQDATREEVLAVGQWLQREEARVRRVLSLHNK